MLQQTTVATVKPRYIAFLERFPDLATLAAATEDDVVAEWSGLGYYHRARNLHRAARLVVERHGGEFPATLPEALALPGVGLYTASAILSISRDVALPVVDANVKRVLARLLCLRGEDGRNEGRLYCRAEELLETQRPGDWNQALMELGATICSPKHPACDACPLRAACRAQADGCQDELPEPVRRRQHVAVTVAAALIEERGRVLLVRRAEGKLMGRFWEVPQTTLESRGLRDLTHELRERHSLQLDIGPLLVRARHAITYRRIQAEGYGARLLRRPPQDRDRYRWATEADLDRLPVSSLTRKLIRGLRRAQLPLQLS
jgi:A/G-specific adenine glycosylase